MASSPLSANQIKIFRACLKANLMPIAVAKHRDERSRLFQMHGRVGLYLAFPGEFREDACQAFDCGTATHPPEWAEEWFDVTSEMMNAWLAALPAGELHNIIIAVVEHITKAVERAGPGFHHADFPFHAGNES